jgi:hypothetical protein
MNEEREQSMRRNGNYQSRQKATPASVGETVKPFCNPTYPNLESRATGTEPNGLSSAAKGAVFRYPDENPNANMQN